MPDPEATHPKFPLGSIPASNPPTNQRTKKRGFLKFIDRVDEPAQAAVVFSIKLKDQPE